MKSYLDICYDTTQEQRLDIYLPEQTDSFPVLVYFHGGGFKGGDKANQEAFCQHMTDRGIAVVSANYRMYPAGAKYPDFVEDAATAVAWVFENIGKYGNAEGIYVGGSSAGGYLSQMLCFDKSWLGKHGIDPMQIAGFVHDAGQPTAHFNVLQEKGIDPRRVIIDETAPLYHVGRDEQYPPMLIIVSDNDLQNRYEQTMLLISTLKHFGHAENITLKVMNGRHCAYIKAVDEAGISVLGKAVAPFIKQEA